VPVPVNLQTGESPNAIYVNRQLRACSSGSYQHHFWGAKFVEVTSIKEKCVGIVRTDRNTIAAFCGVSTKRHERDPVAPGSAGEGDSRFESENPTSRSCHAGASAATPSPRLRGRYVTAGRRER